MKTKYKLIGAASLLLAAINLPRIVGHAMLMNRFDNANYRHILKDEYSEKARDSSLVDRLEMSWGITSGRFSPEDIGIAAQNRMSIMETKSFVEYVVDTVEGNYPTELFPEFAKRGYDWDVSKNLMRAIDDQSLSMDVLRRAENHNIPISEIVNKLDLANDIFLQYYLDILASLDSRTCSVVVSPWNINRIGKLMQDGHSAALVNDYLKIRDSANNPVIIEAKIPFEYIEKCISLGLTASIFQEYIDQMTEDLLVHDWFNDFMRHHTIRLSPKKTGEYLDNVDFSDSNSYTLRENMRQALINAHNTELDPRDFGRYVNAVSDQELEGSFEWATYSFIMSDLIELGVSPPAVRKFYEVAMKYNRSFRYSKDLLQYGRSGVSPEYLDGMLELNETFDVPMDANRICFYHDGGFTVEAIRDKIMSNELKPIDNPQ